MDDEGFEDDELVLLEAEERRIAYIDRVKEASEDLKSAWGVFVGPRGELVLGHLATRYRIHRPLFDADEPLDPLELARREGRREVVLHIIERFSELSTQIVLPKGAES